MKRYFEAWAVITSDKGFSNPIAESLINNNLNYKIEGLKAWDIFKEKKDANRCAVEGNKFLKQSGKKNKVKVVSCEVMIKE